MIIREATLADIENINKLNYKSNKYYNAEKDTKIFIIEEDSRLFGYIEMAYTQHNNLLNIVNIWVDEEVRERGIARKLVKSSKGFARFNKARGIMVKVDTYNYATIRFFIKEGFNILESNEDDCDNNDLVNNKVETYLLFDFK